MKKQFNKNLEERIKALAKEYIETQSDSEFSKDEWYDTPRGFAEQVLKDFFAYLGIELDD